MPIAMRLITMRFDLGDYNQKPYSHQYSAKFIARLKIDALEKHSIYPCISAYKPSKSVNHYAIILRYV